MIARAQPSSPQQSHLGANGWTTAIVSKIDRFVDFLGEHPRIPDAAYDARFHQQLAEIDDLSRSVPGERPKLMHYCFERTARELDQSLVHYQGRNKPFGYAGDYLVMEYTYERFNRSPGRGRMWDEFFHRQDAPRAVCLRKERFGEVLKAVAEARQSRPVRLLDVASGPAREILDGAARANLTAADLTGVCVDADPKAIAYAQGLLGPRWCQSLRFHQGNALRFRTREQFDLVWCAGLFDYLSDRAARLLLHNLWRMVAPGGRLVVGNLACTHRTRPYIEWCGAWFLVHRSEQELMRLSEIAGIPASCCSHFVDDLEAVGFLTAHNSPDPSLGTACR